MIIKKHSVGFIPLFILIILLSDLSMTSAQEMKKFEVSVEGVGEEALKNVEQALSPPEGLIKGDQVDELLLALFLKEAGHKVQEALKPFGYYHAQLTISTDRSPGRVRLLVKVKPGEPVRIATLKIELTGPGAFEGNLREDLSAFPLKEGDILRQDRYEEAKKALQDKVQEAGYLDSDFSVHRINLSLAENQAHIELILETGPRYYFGEILFVPQPNYPLDFLKRYLSFQTGGVFSSRKLAGTQFNFINSSRFKEATIETDKEETVNHHIPVRIRLDPSKPKRFKFGVGYETDKGPGVISRYQDLNFGQMGHELNGELNLSEKSQGAALDYILPGGPNPDTKTTLKMGLTKEITDSYDSQSIFSQGEYVFPFSQGRLGAGYLKILQEDFSVGNQRGLSTFLIPGVRFWERHYDDPLKPTRGFQYSLETRGGIPLLGTEGYFGQFLAQADSMLPLGKGYSLLFRTKGGTTFQAESLKNLPPSLRFFAGGDQSIRGYAYQSLGPKDDSGKVVGGANLIVGSLEIEKAISDKWGLAAFYDIGNAFDDFNRFEPKQGAGLGVRLYTPIGPIRLDLARQIGEKDPQFRIHFSIGFGL